MAKAQAIYNPEDPNQTTAGKRTILGDSNDNNINRSTNTAAVAIFGGEGNDIIRGGAGNDSLYGQTGDDTIVGGYGNDFINAAEGKDHVKTESIGGIDQHFGYDIVYAGTGDDRVNYKDNLDGSFLYGQGGSDFITGGPGEDTIYGDDWATSNTTDGADEIRAGGGNDTVYGGGIDDLIYGGSGNDVVSGGDGNDKIFGEDGNDLMSGNAGADTFVFSTILGTSNVDHITDFVAVDDTIQLAPSVFTQLAPGVLTEGAFVVGDKALDETDRILYNQETGSLSYDADGSGTTAAAVQFAILDPILGTIPTLTHADILIA